MHDLLFLCHRIPYPPNKGDKIRAFRFIEHLSQSYSIHLGCFIDDPNDRQYVTELEKICAQVYGVENMGTARKLKAIPALMRGKSLSVGMFTSKEMTNWTNTVVANEKPALGFVYSSVMAQYLHTGETCIPHILDFVDVDSDKWKQYASSSSFPMKWVYEREAQTLLQFDKLAAERAEAALFVSDSEASLFRSLAPESRNKIKAVHNGIDYKNFSQNEDWPNPYCGQGPHLVFTGSMDYWPNVDAVTWFVLEIFPSIRDAWPTATFNIVGANPASSVRALRIHENVNVTGSVAEVQPYLAHAHAAVAPLRIARGIQNKVLEAMAMALPTIVTNEALEGIEAKNGAEVLIANEPQDYIEAVRLITSKDKALSIGKCARERVVKDYSWEDQFTILDEIIDQTVQSNSS